MIDRFKKLFIVFGFFTLKCPPPVLPQHAKNVCWHNAALQLLRNIKPITLELIADKKKKKEERTYYGKGNADVDAYIDFLEASMLNDTKKITTALNKLYQLSCPRFGITTGEAFYPYNVLKFFEIQFPDLIKKYFGFPHTLNGYLALNDVALGFFETSELPEYILLELAEVECIIPEKNQELKKQYEMIGVIDANKLKTSHQNKMVFAGGGHFWAWIKDEFDDKHPWYKRNDTEPKLVAPQLFNIQTLQCPLYVLYKKRKVPLLELEPEKIVEKSDSDTSALKRLAQSLKSIG